MEQKELNPCNTSNAPEEPTWSTSKQYTEPKLLHSPDMSEIMSNDWNFIMENKPEISLEINTKLAISSIESIFKNEQVAALMDKYQIIRILHNALFQGLTINLHTRKPIDYVLLDDIYSMINIFTETCLLEYLYSQPDYICTQSVLNNKNKRMEIIKNIVKGENLSLFLESTSRSFKKWFSVIANSQTGCTLGYFRHSACIMNEQLFTTSYVSIIIEPTLNAFRRGLEADRYTHNKIDLFSMGEDGIYHIDKAIDLFIDNRWLLHVYYKTPEIQETFKLSEYEKQILLQLYMDLSLVSDVISEIHNLLEDDQEYTDLLCNTTVSNKLSRKTSFKQKKKLIDSSLKKFIDSSDKSDSIKNYVIGRVGQYKSLIEEKDKLTAKKQKRNKFNKNNILAALSTAMGVFAFLYKVKTRN
ncbi:hypothetical protein NEPAR05_0700 [Nematocida parisii]|uniref:Uncharacterized protein n=1 Tax=Nematocida parisii (strain ERTm3) TaxID=935791 RepID=I3EF08_NEMP3|nr:hypothetical protein NEQG_01877 [Nematocida parisii ERTm3]KAI5143563.1 hypothetical protein NEPAR07_0692 [Nematocida parisii]KAI5156585.1 hypothetical protein NEPAR05_0700 [Nematocida parisii]